MQILMALVWPKEPSDQAYLHWDHMMRCGDEDRSLRYVSTQSDLETLAS